MRMLSAISIKKKEEPLLPQTIESPADQEGNSEKVKSDGKAKVTPSTTKKTQKKKFLKGFLDGVATVLFIMVCLAPGFLLGFSGGSYYQYKKMAPYVNQNWKLSTELWKMESMISVMNNLLVYEEKGEAEKWFYRMSQGYIECNYNPLSPQSSTTTTPPPSTVAPPSEDYETQEYPDSDVKGDMKKDTEGDIVDIFGNDFY